MKDGFVSMSFLFFQGFFFRYPAVGFEGCYHTDQRGKPDPVGSSLHPRGYVDPEVPGGHCEHGCLQPRGEKIGVFSSMWSLRCHVLTFHVKR